MKYATIILAALAAAVNAVKFTNSVIDPEPGKPFELTWSDASGAVTILLKTGPSSNLETVDTLVSGATGESATITLDPSKYPSGTYAFEIVDDSGVPNYSEQFAFQGSGTISKTASATGSSTRATTTLATTSSSATESSTSQSSTETETSSRTSSARPSRTSDADEEETSVPGAAGRVASPLALVLVTVAAMFYLN
ncbi:hypothetical protein jhhlp_007098 [Lomentospora prolificans]|uniref:Yeast cell wall synthesis Kre9/Knh1-like N-terminal domain-containing protein n=1 Tax=Lomentospora prolificans TaxID=41688 RepID=A0A2N3N1P2_9PEZI|nr:hypothetical protein jhhlp_007098 [Lomentospora prolificans]